MEIEEQKYNQPTVGIGEAQNFKSNYSFIQQKVCKTKDKQKLPPTWTQNPKTNLYMMGATCTDRWIQEN